MHNHEHREHERPRTHTEPQLQEGINLLLDQHEQMREDHRYDAPDAAELARKLAAVRTELHQRLCTGR